MISCRNCHKSLISWEEKSGEGSGPHVFCDLGHQPLANNYLESYKLQPEITYPLRPVICPHCTLVQLPTGPTIEQVFSHYSYFSSQSLSWVEHCQELVQTVQDQLLPVNRVLEIASNDGALLDAFRCEGITAFGVEPAANIALAAQAKGLGTVPEFFGMNLAKKLAVHGKVALVVALNVLAHVPDLDDFLGGIKLILADNGRVIFEFPDLDQTIKNNDFGQIYQEHLSFFDSETIQSVLQRRGFQTLDIEEIDTHGGSLRVWAMPGSGRFTYPPNESEKRQRVASLEAYAQEPPKLKQRLLSDLLAYKALGGRIWGYGAPAKGTVLLNYLGVGPEMIEAIVDTTPAKQGTYLPGCHIPVLHPSALDKARPEYIFILPHNWADECARKLAHTASWGARLFTAREEIILSP